MPRRERGRPSRIARDREAQTAKHPEPFGGSPGSSVAAAAVSAVVVVFFACTIIPLSTRALAVVLRCFDIRWTDRDASSLPAYWKRRKWAERGSTRSRMLLLLFPTVFYLFIFGPPSSVGSKSWRWHCRAHLSRPCLSSSSSPAPASRSWLYQICSMDPKARNTERESVASLYFLRGAASKEKGRRRFFFLQKPLRPHARPPLSPSKKKQTNKTLLRTPPSTRSSSASSTPAPAGPAAPSPSPRPRSAPSASPRARS